MSDATDSPTAVLGRRYVAHLIDLVVHAATVAVPFLLLGERSTVARPDGEPYADTFAVGADRAFRVGDQQFVFERSEIFLIAAVSLAVAVLFFVLIQGRFGWTIGKLVTGIRTVGHDGGRPGVIRAFFRTLFIPVDALPSDALPLVGGLVAR